ncbi:MAG: SDR family oxidoreductase [Planctomycetota bacterium]
MDLGIKGRVALVTASSRGLGRACAIALAKEGAKVSICAREKDKLIQAEGELKSLGATVYSAVTDLNKLGDIDRLVEGTRTALGPIDILVANTGGPPIGYFLSLSSQMWEDAFRLLVEGVAHLARLVLPGMKERKWGRIVAIESTSVKQPIDGLVLSNSLRMAVVGMFKSIALEAAASGVRVNVVCPGSMDTDAIQRVMQLGAQRDGVTIEEARARLEKGIPVGRMGKPEELADVVAFLASERSSFVTGVTLPVDGGMIRGH